MHLTVGLRDVRFRAGHGVHPEEAIIGGDYRVQVTCTLPARDAPVDEDLSATLDYSRLYQLCQEVFAVRADLLETLAERIIERVRKTFPAQVTHVAVEIEKLHPPLGGRVGAAWVRVEDDVRRPRTARSTSSVVQPLP